MKLDEILAAGRSLFGDAFNPLIAQKALVSFKVETVEQAVRDVLVREALAEVGVKSLPLVSSRLA